MVGLLHIAAISLVVAGALKVRNPAPTVAALAGVWSSVRTGHVITIGVAEIASGVAVCVAGGSAAALSLALLYASFAGFVAVALWRQGDAARCGCFGVPDAPPSRLHVVMNAAIAVAAAAMAASGPPSLPTTVADQPIWGVPYLILLGAGATTLFLIVDRLPRLHAAARLPSGGVR